MGILFHLHTRPQTQACWLLKFHVPGCTVMHLSAWPRPQAKRRQYHSYRNPAKTVFVNFWA